MKDYEQTPLERAVFAEMAERNPGTTPEMIYETSIHNDRRYIFHYFSTKSRPPLVDVSPLVKLGLDEVTLYQCQVRDISPLANISTLVHLTISGGPEFLPCDLTALEKLQSLHLHTTPLLYRSQAARTTVLPLGHGNRQSGMPAGNAVPCVAPS